MPHLHKKHPKPDQNTHNPMACLLNSVRLQWNTLSKKDGAVEKANDIDMVVSFQKANSYSLSVKSIIL